MELVQPCDQKTYIQVSLLKRKWGHKQSNKATVSSKSLVAVFSARGKRFMEWIMQSKSTVYSSGPSYSCTDYIHIINLIIELRDVRMQRQDLMNSRKIMNKIRF